jgi:hypothetical protein
VFWWDVYQDSFFLLDLLPALLDTALLIREFTALLVFTA